MYKDLGLLRATTQSIPSARNDGKKYKRHCEERNQTLSPTQNRTRDEAIPNYTVKTVFKDLRLLRAITQSIPSARNDGKKYKRHCEERNQTLSPTQNRTRDEAIPNYTVKTICKDLRLLRAITQSIPSARNDGKKHKRHCEE